MQPVIRPLQNTRQEWILRSGPVAEKRLKPRITKYILTIFLDHVRRQKSGHMRTSISVLFERRAVAGGLCHQAVFEIQSQGKPGGIFFGSNIPLFGLSGQLPFLRSHPGSGHCFLFALFGGRKDQVTGKIQLRSLLQLLLPK